MNIEEIALRVANDMCSEQHPAMQYGVNTRFTIDFAKRLLAELSKDAEPVAWGNFKDDGTPCLLSISQHPEDRANWMNPKPLFTHPALVITSEQQPVAHAFYNKETGDSCAMLVDDPESIEIVQHGDSFPTIKIAPLFTSPPTPAEIEQRVAEACAMVASQHNDFYLNCVEIAKKIRSGKWREYL